MHRHTPLALTVLLAAATLQAATPVTLPDPGPADLSPARLVTGADIPQLVEPRRDPVQFTRALPADSRLDPVPAPHTATSRGYTLRASAAELAAGIPIHTTAPGAVVRINPLRTGSTDELVALDPSRVQIAPHGATGPTSGGVIPLATAGQLAAADVPFPEGSSAFRIDPSLGAGAFILRAPDLPAEGEARYVVAVVEPESPVLLKLTADSLAYLAGGRGSAEAVLETGGPPLENPMFGAILVAPDGQILPLTVDPGADGTARISFALERMDPGAQGLWEISLSASGTVDGLLARREVRTAFGTALPTARFAGVASIEPRDDGLTVTFPVEVAAPGRYEVRAVLWGLGDDGAMHPAVLAQSAAWLEPGTESLGLGFGDGLLEGTGLHAPWELRNLELRDQGRLGVLEVRTAGPSVDLPVPRNREGPER